MESGGASRRTNKEAESRYGRVTNNVNFLHLESYDNLGTSFVSSPLIGDNYLTWSRSMKIALRAKFKLNFIIGKYKKPVNKSSNEFEQWNRIDCMVQSWILNSISKEIVDAFLYTNYAKELWENLRRVLLFVMGHRSIRCKEI